MLKQRVGSRLPDQRCVIAVLHAADDAGIVEIEVIVAQVDLDRADATIAERIGRLDAVELAALVAASVSGGQEVADFGIAAEKGRIGCERACLRFCQNPSADAWNGPAMTAASRPVPNSLSASNPFGVDEPGRGEVHERALAIAHGGVFLAKIVVMQRTAQVQLRIAQLRHQDDAPIDAAIVRAGVGEIVGEDTRLRRGRYRCCTRSRRRCAARSRKRR